MSVDTFERRVEQTFATGSVSDLRRLLAERRVARALVVPGDEIRLGSCPIRPD